MSSNSSFGWIQVTDDEIQETSFPERRESGEGSEERAVDRVRGMRGKEWGKVRELAIGTSRDLFKRAS
jgi:hypothetical protein